MKLKLYVLLSVVASIFLNELSAQAPGVKSLQYYSSPLSGNVVYDSKLTHDKGFVLAGVDTFIGGVFLTANVLDRQIRVPGQGLITRVDSSGRELWRKRPLVNSIARSIDVCSDGGYIVAGSSLLSLDTASFMIIKMNSAGTTQWVDRLGGSREDDAYSIIEASQGGYIVVGSTRSTDGDVIGNHGTTTKDVWVVRLDAGGAVTWKKCFGGLQNDIAYSVIEAPDHGFIVAGSSSSSDGDLTGNKGSTDGWLFKIDGAGNMQWQKNIGGSFNETFRALTLAEDGGIVVVGNTASVTGDVSGNHGQADLWIVKCSMAGDIIWSKCFGGTLDEFAMSVERTLNNEYLIGSFTNSTNGDVTFNNGNSDVWIVLVSATGNLIWQKTVGNSNSEFATAANVVSVNQFAFVGSGLPSATSYFNGLFGLLGNVNTIKGNVFVDANSNGIRDNGEKAFSDALLKVDKGGVIVSSIPYNGRFSVDADLGSFTTSLTVNSPYYTVTPSSHTSNFASYLNVDSFDFALQPIPMQKDLSINAIPLTPARPGFNSAYQLLYSNVGTENISNVMVSLTIDAKTSFVSSTPVPSNISGNTLQWNIGSLNTSQTGSIYVNLKVAVPPGVNNGDTLRFLATIDPVSGDLTPANDTFRLKQLVTGSFDPNDKTEVNAGKITPKQINDGDYLTYLIRFQNTGTDTAFTVNVRDTLDAQLDWNTLQMISASHTYNLQVKDGNKITWTFDNIKLADSNRNEPASHGYIAYRIKPKATLAAGDIINNTAAIYFDFNLPVQTNLQQTKVGDPAPLPVTLGRFQVYLKRDKTVQVEWRSLIEINTAYFEVERSSNGIAFTSIGKVPAKNAAGGAAYTLVDNKPVNGINYYRLKTTDADGKNGYSAVVKINLDEKPVIITTIYPNPAQQQFRLEVKGAIKDRVTMKLLWSNGQPVLTKDLGNIDADSLTLPVNIEHFPAGLYILQVEVGQRIYRNKLVVQ